MSRTVKKNLFEVYFGDNPKQGYTFEISYEDLHQKSRDDIFQTILTELNKAGVRVSVRTVEEMIDDET